MATSVYDPRFGTVTAVIRACPLCGAANTDRSSSRYSVAPWIIKDCPACGLTYLSIAARYEELEHTLAWSRTSNLHGADRAATLKKQKRLSRLIRRLRRPLPRKTMQALVARYAAPGPVLDIGCGDGAHMDDLPAGYIPYGLEVDAFTVTQAEARFSPRGGSVVHAAALEGLRQCADGFFTSATLRSYLEHELDPGAVLAEVHRVLAPGGIALVKVPNFGSLNRRVMGRRWCGFRYPDHVNYFTPATLRAMATRAGFACWYGLGWRLPISDNMWALLRKPA